MKVTAKTQNQENTNEARKNYVGLEQFSIVAVNPTTEEINALYERTPKEDEKEVDEEDEQLEEGLEGEPKNLPANGAKTFAKKTVAGKMSTSKGKATATKNSGKKGKEVKKVAGGKDDGAFGKSGDSFFK